MTSPHEHIAPLVSENILSARLADLKSGALKVPGDVEAAIKEVEDALKKLRKDKTNRNLPLGQDQQQPEASE